MQWYSFNNFFIFINIIIIDINECEVNLDECNVTTSICNNTIGGYNCSCRSGFYMSGPNECSGMHIINHLLN